MGIFHDFSIMFQSFQLITHHFFRIFSFFFQRNWRLNASESGISPISSSCGAGQGSERMGFGNANHVLIGLKMDQPCLVTTKMVINHGIPDSWMSFPPGFLMVEALFFGGQIQMFDDWVPIFVVYNLFLLVKTFFWITTRPNPLD